MMRSSLLHGTRIAATLMLAVLWLGCDGDDGGGSGERLGTSSIRGTVDSFELPGAATGLTLPAVGALRGGIRVRLLGTDLSTTTADDGLFVMGGVPAGPRTLRFEYHGVGANYQINVPEDAELIMNRIRVREQSVTCDSIQVRERARPPEQAPNLQGGGEGELDRDRDRDQVQSPDQDQDRTRRSQSS